MVPEDDQAMVLPWASVMVIMVLLNDAFTCATPDAMFFLSRRRTRAVASLPILFPFAAARVADGRSVFQNLRRRRRSLLAGDRPRRALARARIGVGALAANRKTLAVAQAAVATEVHQ